MHNKNKLYALKYTLCILIYLIFCDEINTFFLLFGVTALSGPGRPHSRGF